MDYVVDLDPTHRVLRTTVTTLVLDDEAFKEMNRSIARLANTGGPYAAAILDLSQVADFPLSSDTVRALAAAAPPEPASAPRVIVAPQPVQYGLSRMFELHRDAMGVEVQVVHSMDEAYEFLKVSPEDFTEHLFPDEVAA
jgi:hypothetical protein